MRGRVVDIFPPARLYGLTPDEYAEAYERGWRASSRPSANLDSNPYPRQARRRSCAWEDGYLDRSRDGGAHKWATPLLGYAGTSGEFTEEEYDAARKAARHE